MKNKYSIDRIWFNDVEHRFCSKNQTTANMRVKNLIEMLGCDNIKKIDENPQIIDDFRKKLINYTQPSGKNKGKPYSQKTIKEYFRLFRQIIRISDENFTLKNADKMYRKLSMAKITNLQGLNPKKERVPLTEQDYETLFTALKDMRDGKFIILNKLIQNNGDFKKRLEFIKKYPDAHYFAVLIALFTGSRANASCTIRHQDIDLENETVHIHISGNDNRERAKHLKTEESNRLIPLSKTLMYDLGFKDYLIQHEKEYGNEAFIFEEVIYTSNNSYKPTYINENINILMNVLGIKPDKNSNYMKDFHSLKKCFYSANVRVGIPLEMLEAIAGNKPSNQSIAAKTYAKISMETAPTAMREAVNNITYPHLDILTGNGTVKKQTTLNLSSNNELKEYISKLVGQPIKGMIILYM